MINKTKFIPKRTYKKLIKFKELFYNNQKLLNSHNMIIPKNGLIVIFPSWLNHSVLPNKSNKNRISISFNIDKL